MELKLSHVLTINTQAFLYLEFEFVYINTPIRCNAITYTKLVLKPKSHTYVHFPYFSFCDIVLYILVQHLLRVIPVIGLVSNIKEFNPTPNDAEVESVFDAPLEMFLKVFYYSSYI